LGGGVGGVGGGGGVLVVVGWGVGHAVVLVVVVVVVVVETAEGGGVECWTELVAQNVGERTHGMVVEDGARISETVRLVKRLVAWMNAEQKLLAWCSPDWRLSIRHGHTVRQLSRNRITLHDHGHSFRESRDNRNN